MNKSKLISILQTLSKSEWNALDKFVHSPFYNQHKEVQHLFLYLKELEIFDERALEERLVFQKAFKKETKFNKVKLKYVRSYLLKLVERFLATKEWESNPFEVQIALASAYKKRNIVKKTSSTLQLLRKKEDKYPFRNADYFKRQYQLELENYRWNEKQRRRGEMNLQNLSNALEIAFVIEKLKHSATMLTHQAVYKTEYETGMLEQVLDYVSKSDLINIPAVAIYFHSYLALKNTTITAHFYALKSLIKANVSLFPQDELKNMFLLAINFCIRQINTGNKIFEQELLDLYKTGLENNAFIESGTLSRWTYKNIVEIGLGLKDFEWIDYFIHHYKSYIEKAYQENMFNYNLAKLNYRRKKYDNAMILLLKVTEKDLLLLLDVKRLLCKIYYETAEWKVLDSHLHSFELYVRRQKEIGYHKQNYLNFTKCLKKLIKLNTYEKKEIVKLRKTIIDYKILPEKRWLLEQIPN